MVKRILFIGLLALAGCVPKRTVTAPASVPTVTPPPAPVAPPPLAWEDRPRTLGEWRYAGSATRTAAAYLARDADGGVSEELVVACEPASRMLKLAVSSRAARMTVRTSTLARSLTLVEGTIGDDAYRIATVPASDTLLDAMVFSRGKFLLAVEGRPDLIIPPWPELARVVEDCRG